MVCSVSSLSRATLALGLLSLLSAGCDCRSQAVNRNLGEIGVIWRDADNNRITSRDALYDFGQALVGERKDLSLTVRNTGAGRLTLAKLEQTDGDETVIASAGTDTSVFESAFSRTDLQPSEQADFKITFSPKGLKGDYLAKLKLTAEGTRSEDSTAVITLKGQGEKGSCDLPTVIDFGKVAIGETFPFYVPFRNPTGVDAVGVANDITGDDATSFGYGPTSPKGMVTVPKMTTTNVIVTFSPTEKRQYTAQVVMRGPGSCPDATIAIRGEGSDETLTWSPTSLTYGYVSPGSEAIKMVTFINPATAPVVLSMITASDPADFYHAVPAGQDQTTFVIPGGGVPTDLPLACNPASLGKHTGSMTFKTGLVKTPSGSIALDCIGGGPLMKVTPQPTLAFGRVGYFPGNSMFSVVRKVNIQNIGTKPPVADVTANLFLGQVIGGTNGNLPLWEFAPKNAATDPTEFVVSLGSGYNPAKGLEAVAGSNFIDLIVKLTPKSVGMKEAELKIYSNDPVHPVAVVQITADVQELPPCKYSVTPASANFGLVAPGVTKDLPIIITNTGSGPDSKCYFSGIDLAAGSNLAYSVVGGAIVDKELDSAQSFQVVVRVAPTGATPTTLQTLTGVLAFNVTSPDKPQGIVPLTTSVGPTCLAVTPDPLDFGTVKLGCNSAAKTFNIYNVCTSNVTVKSFAMQAAAGQPYGGPNCTIAAGCPEFFIASTPTIPGGGLVIAPGTAPVTFQAKYAPIDIGPDSGAIAINAIQDGQSITYLVALAGAGDTTGQQTDTFLQDKQPKADILLVVDDSGSMGDKQASLAMNFGSFIQYAVSADVDYHLGVTTTTGNEEPVCVPVFGCVKPTSKAWGGELYKDTQLGVRYLTPATPNISQVFGRMVNVGTDGSGLEQGLATAVLALTPPKVSNENAGFLRTEANLAIVVISDASDQSDQPVSYYQNRLVNVKGFNRLSMFTFSNIGPYDPGINENSKPCAYDGDHDPGRYKTIVDATSGVRDEICNPNWSSALQNLGKTVFGFRTQFYLNTTPDLTNGHTIDVKVDGVVVPQGATTWSYDSTTNSVKFVPAATPPAGKPLTVSYTSMCF